MSRSVAFVGAGRERARQLADSLSDDRVRVVAKSWSRWLHQPVPRRKPDLIIYDLTATDAPSTNRLAELPERVREARVLYMTDNDLSQLEPLGPAVRKLTSDFVPASANVRELSQRTRRLLESVDTPTAPAPQAKQKSRVQQTKTRQSANGTTASSRLPALGRLVPELHDPQSGRLDARAVSSLFGVKLAVLARALNRTAAAVHKTPDAPSLQAGLAVYERIAASLLHLAGSPEGLRIWMNASNPELDNATPLQILLGGEGDVVADLLEDVMMGEPS